MDLQDFCSDMLYFDEPLSLPVELLLQRAANAYGEGSAEPLLLKAYASAPDNLSVLVSLYRFYYYQHRYPQALEIAQRVMDVVAPRIDFPVSWQEITLNHIANGVMASIGLVRFYLFALKAAGYIGLRMGHYEPGIAMLEKVVALDTADRLGAQLLLDVMSTHKAQVVPFPIRLQAGVKT
jgi:tetratricopeptide (TPR) repeat protein